MKGVDSLTESVRSVKVRYEHEFCSWPEIQIRLGRERARSNRNGREFTLVLFGIVPQTNGNGSNGHAHGHSNGNGNGSGKVNGRVDPQLAELAETVRRRARETDDVGWFDDTMVCAILPDTLTKGGWRFAEEVCTAMGNPSPLTCRVWTYPVAWMHPGLPSEARNSNGNGHANGENKDEDDNDPTPPDGGRPLTAVDLLPAFLSGIRLGAEEETERSEETEQLQTIFADPMPRWKRMLDVIGASIGIVAAFPLMLLIGAAVKLTTRGPVIFRQSRAGYAGIPFIMYKFRTMYDGAEYRQKELRRLSEQDGPAFKLTRDPRVTRLGRILRKTSLDELPQLFNVLKGQMSLVGPRPLPCVESDECLVWQRRRLDVTPGITCIWQVEGRSRVTFEQWMRMDIHYIRRRSVMQDMRLLLQTVPAVLLRRGAT